MKPTTPAQHDFGAHFEETVAKAASSNLEAKPIAFFLPTTAAIDTKFDAIRMRVQAKRMEQVDEWIRRELVQHLGDDVCALPNDEFAATVQAAGIYGREIAFPDDGPGVMRFALYGRVEGGPDDLLASMTFEPTLDPAK